MKCNHIVCDCKSKALKEIMYEICALEGRLPSRHKAENDFKVLVDANIMLQLLDLIDTAKGVLKIAKH